jgi:hypothetical protein
MGEYKLSIYGQWSVGVSVSYEYGQIIIRVPFTTIYISTSKWAKGVLLFGKEFN